MNKLSGKVALVTGGNSGIGLAAARRFAAEGAQVIITGRRRQAVDEAVERIGAGALGIQGDVSSIAHHEAVAAHVRATCGGLDIYMANAGINAINHSSAVSPEEYDAQFAVNARGVFFGVQKMVPVMRDGALAAIAQRPVTDKALGEASGPPTWASVPWLAPAGLVAAFPAQEYPPWVTG